MSYFAFCCAAVAVLALGIAFAEWTRGKTWAHVISALAGVGGGK